MLSDGGCTCKFYSASDTGGDPAALVQSLQYGLTNVS